MKFSNLEQGEVVAMFGGAILAVAVFLAWYRLGNDNTTLGDVGPGHGGETVSGWKSLSVLRILLLLAALSPFILAYIVVREHALSWPRGELTAVVGLTAVTLVLIRGFILKPGEPTSQVSLQVGWVIAFVGAGLILFGALIHQAKTGTDRPRKPPGVL
jgi:hypothetical protein